MATSLLRLLGILQVNLKQGECRRYRGDEDEEGHKCPIGAADLSFVLPVIRRH